MLVQAGFTDDEVEVLLAEAVEESHNLSKQQVRPSDIFDEAETALGHALEAAEMGVFEHPPIHPEESKQQQEPRPPRYRRSQQPALPPLSPEQQIQKKKKKLFSGIGKLIGGSTAGVVNVLALTGTIIAPNPATFYGAIASGGIAVSTLFGGIGDLRGE